MQFKTLSCTKKPNNKTKHPWLSAAQTQDFEQECVDKYGTTIKNLEFTQPSSTKKQKNQKRIGVNRRKIRMRLV